jgi:hypothetical protein
MRPTSSAAKFEFVTFGLTQREIDVPVRMKGALLPLIDKDVDYGTL